MSYKRRIQTTFHIMLFNQFDEHFCLLFLLYNLAFLNNYQSIALDDTRCGLDASSLHLDTSMVNYKAKKFGLLSCNLDTFSTAREKQKKS